MPASCALLCPAVRAPELARPADVRFSACCCSCVLSCLSMVPANCPARRCCPLVTASRYELQAARPPCGCACDACACCSRHFSALGVAAAGTGVADASDEYSGRGRSVADARTPLQFASMAALVARALGPAAAHAAWSRLLPSLPPVARTHTATGFVASVASSPARLLDSLSLPELAACACGAREPCGFCPVSGRVGVEGMV